MWIPSEKPRAAARLAGCNAAPCLYGTVKFYQIGKNLLVVADIAGLPSNSTGDCFLHIRGLKRHPLLFSREGNAFLVFLTDQIASADLIGSTVTIYDPDAADAPLAAGIIFVE